MVKKEAAGTSIYQIKVTLRDSKPPIWRRVQVPGDATLADLHDIIQAVMSWWDYHLHQFIVGESYYGVPHPDYMMDMLDETEVRLNEIADEGAKFFYEYDFGDSWLHTLDVEKVMQPEPGQEYPVCLKGRRATPPEDVGGIWGYERYLEAMENPDHPEHEMYMGWRGEFEPEAFDLDEVNAELRKRVGTSKLA
jgi:hypothetical protein